MASHNTLSLRNAQRDLHPRVSFLGQWDKNEKGQLRPIADKPFRSRSGIGYVYNRSGAISRLDPKTSKQRRRHRCGGWRSYHEIRDTQMQLDVERELA